MIQVQAIYSAKEEFLKIEYLRTATGLITNHTFVASPDMKLLSKLLIFKKNLEEEFGGQRILSLGRDQILNCC